eukprot:1588118-Pleurochrysis_carterae.AAC.3
MHNQIYLKRSCPSVCCTLSLYFTRVVLASEALEAGPTRAFAPLSAAPSSLAPRCVSGQIWTGPLAEFEQVK